MTAPQGPSLQQVAKSLGIGRRQPRSGACWTYDELIDQAVILYWQRRPNVRPECGTEPGYRAHLLQAEPTCAACREAHAAVTAIRRLRRMRGIRISRPAPLACGTHAAFNRHRVHGEPIDPACEVAERLYQRSRKRTQRDAA
jgi:hypothetical protein